jgi:perosamine synthetase
MANYLQLGYNWRMSSMTAALGISQLHKLDKIIKMRQNNAVYISERLKKIPEIQVPSPPNDYDHIYQMYSIRLANNQIREKLHEFLLDKSIFSKVYFYPIHKTSFYQNQISTIDSNLPITESVSNEILTLPMYPNMTNEEKNYLVESIYEFFETKQI